MDRNTDAKGLIPAIASSKFSQTWPAGNKKKLTVSGRSPDFSKVLDLQKLTGRLLRTLDSWIMGDSPSINFMKQN